MDFPKELLKLATSSELFNPELVVKACAELEKDFLTDESIKNSHIKIN